MKHCSSTWSIVVGELREQKEFRPVILLIIAEDAEVLLECLISAFSLTITFRMISRSEMKSHVEGFSKQAEKVGDELRSTIGGNMLENSVLGENMEHE